MYGAQAIVIEYVTQFVQERKIGNIDYREGESKHYHFLTSY